MRYWAIIISCVFLQSCTTHIMQEQRLTEGKKAFLAGDYYQAFNELMPIASEGNATAEYAVGYMYYYGYGPTEDNTKGLFWMRKSADQHYPPAMKALDVIAQKSDQKNMDIKIQ